MEEQPPDTDRLYVPLREAGCGVALRLFRDRDGSRCAVGFTGADRLAMVLGARQKYCRLTERAVRELARERGVDALVVDPGMVAVPVRERIELEPAGAVRSAWDAHAAGILAVSARPVGARATAK